MPDAYEIHDAQFLQYKESTSAANALYINLGPVPAGKVWTLLAVSGSCNVSEAQIYWYTIYGAGGTLAVTRPESFAINPTNVQDLPFVREGMEVKLFPGEFIQLRRAAATAGSTITIKGRFIENDIQYYIELDKQKVFQRRQIAMMASSPSASRSVSAGTRASTLRDIASPVRTPRER